MTHQAFVDRNLDTLERVARLSTGRLAILVGFVDRNPLGQGKPLMNAAALCRSGRVVERRYKSLLPTYDVFDEDRYFEPAHDVSPMPCGDVRLGVTICEDLWHDKDLWPKPRYHRDPICEVVAAGADVLINISASPFRLDVPDVRRRLVTQEAVKHGRYFVYVNQVGGNDELVFDGHSIGIAPDGTTILRAAEFEEDVVTIDVPVLSEVERPASEAEDRRSASDPHRFCGRWPSPTRSRRFARSSWGFVTTRASAGSRALSSVSRAAWTRR